MFILTSRTRNTCLCLAALSLGAAFISAQAIVPAAVQEAAERITAEQLKRDLDFLASDELQGRNTPSAGFDAAAEHIEKRLAAAGIKPLGDDGSYRQHYVMRETTLTTEEAALQIGAERFAPEEDFVLRTFTGELMTEPLQAVYVGHGWTAPGVDPYQGLDVKGKLVVVHAQDARPPGVRQLGRVTIGGTAPLVEAHRRGALAVLYLARTGNRSEPPRRGSGAVVRRELDPSVPSAYAAPPLTSIQLGERATAALLKDTKLDAAKLEEPAKTQAYLPSFELPARVAVRLPATTVSHRPFNVVGFVEGTDPQMKNEFITIESHLDGAVGTRPVDGDNIYNAADDNATGSAANLAIAEQMVSVRPKRSLIFIWDSGEEQGLWGTRHFVANPPVPLADIVAHVNIDMIGANRVAGSVDAADERVTGPNEVYLIGPGVLSGAVDALLRRVNEGYLKLSLNRKFDTPDSEFFYPRTDAGPFLERGVLPIGFFTGLHERYHLPADEAHFLDVEKMTAIARTIFVMIHAVASTPERPGIDKPVPPTVLQVQPR